MEVPVLGVAISNAVEAIATAVITAGEITVQIQAEATLTVSSFYVNSNPYAVIVKG